MARTRPALAGSVHSVLSIERSGRAPPSPARARITPPFADTLRRPEPNATEHAVKPLALARSRRPGSIHPHDELRTDKPVSRPASRSARIPFGQARALPAGLLAAGLAAIAGLSLGFALGNMTHAPPGDMAVLLAIAAGIALAIAAFVVLQTFGRRGASRAEIDACDDTARAIEHALATPGCAAAHAVSAIARAGLIDHLVATPVRLWAIAVVDRRVPRDELPAVLARIADNTAAVWDWAPAGTPVRGCLVLGHEVRPERNQYDYGKGPVVVHTPDSLSRELTAEAKLPPELDERVADEVWNLRPRPVWRAGSTSPERAARQGGPDLRSPNSPATDRCPLQQRLNRDLSRAR